jgi:hypothetical protein
MLTVLRDYAIRGGYCHCVGRYRGPIWKYDINQAYAHAMRASSLPCGNFHRAARPSRYARSFFVCVRGRLSGNRVPFYCRINVNGRTQPYFATDTLPETWITHLEFEQLSSEGWTLEILDSFWSGDCFSMQEYVDKLEGIRSRCDGGPSGAIGTMVKAVGNHSYGKTLEQLSPMDLVIAADCPEGFVEYFSLNESEFFFPHLWARPKSESSDRDYHQPAIGAVITSFVRMQVRRAALVAPDAWLYADTDCVAFSRDVTDLLEIHPRRYGAFKVEESGDEFLIVGKKIYASAATKLDKRGRVVPKIAHCKGLNVRELSSDDFNEWMSGVPPSQSQVQRNNFTRVMTGADMFRSQTRTGTRI